MNVILKQIGIYCAQNNQCSIWFGHPGYNRLFKLIVLRPLRSIWNEVDLVPLACNSRSGLSTLGLQQSKWT